MLRVFADNDVLLDAAHWGFLDYIPTLTGAPWTATSVPGSLIHRTRKKDPKIFAHPIVAEELEERLKLAVDPPGLDRVILSRLEEEVGLDVGEVILIAGFTFWIAHGDALLLTGDKRALRALAHPRLADIAGILKGKVLCREHLLRHVLDVDGVKALVDGVDKARNRDTATDCIVPRGSRTSELSIREGLASYIDELAIHTDSLLLP